MSFSAAALSVLLILGPQAPAHPDFSGRWVLVAPAATPADVPALLVVQQHMKRTDIRGNPMTPFWHLLIVEGDDSKKGIRTGTYEIGRMGGTVGGGIVGPDGPAASAPTRMTQESVTWEGDTLLIWSAEWVERQKGKRESYEQHTEAWALDEQGRLTITVSGGSRGPGTRKVIYEKEQARR